MPLLFPSAGKTNITHQHNYTYTGTSWTFIKVRHGASRGQHRIYDSFIYDDRSRGSSLVTPRCL